MKKAWTLLEILVVLVIIVILATFAIPQYIKATKKAISSEAIKTISSLKDALIAYHLENGGFTENLDDLDVANPNKREEAKFGYRIIGSSIERYKIIAEGKKATRAEGIKVTYDTATHSYEIDYQGEKIGGKKVE